MVHCLLFQYFKSMNNFQIFFFILLICMLVHGCSKSEVSNLSFTSSLQTQKINNLIDVSGDKRSDLIFWNTSTMSAPGKFLELCFFEVIDPQKNSYTKIKLGEVSDVPFLGYFDEDSAIDYGIYRSSPNRESTWVVKSGGKDNAYNTTLGGIGDLPVPCDYDGDERFDIAVYSPSNNTFDGVLSRSKLPFKIKLGIKGDFPVPKDYDGDGSADLATYRPKNGVWTIKKTRDNTVSETVLGGPSFLPIPADYDGDGKADLCVYSYIDKTVKLLLSGQGTGFSKENIKKIKEKLGNKDFFPVSADYDGDGVSELAFWSKSLKLLLTFKVGEDLNQRTYHFPKLTNSFPVNNFLLNRVFVNKYIPSSVLTVNGLPALFLFEDGKIMSFEFAPKLKVLRSSLSSWSKKENVLPFVSDFDGDYMPDACFWSADTGTFLCESSRVGWKFALEIGQKTDIPVIGNFDGNNITDIGVYRPSIQSFYYRILGKSAPVNIQTVKLSEDAGLNGIPQISDYDGDGIDDFAVYNPQSNVFIIRKSSSGEETKTVVSNKDEYDLSPVTPVVGDFDGDGKSDPGVVYLESGKFSYYSLLFGKLISHSFNKKLSNLTFTADIDQDLRSDLVFFNLEDSSLGIAESSMSLEYTEIKFDDKKMKDIKLVNYPWLDS